MREGWDIDSVHIVDDRNHYLFVVLHSPLRKPASFPPIAPPLHSPLKRLTLIAKQPALRHIVSQ